MIVVSDTTALNYLVLIGAVDVLPRLFREVYTPHSVIRELSDRRAPAIVRQWASSLPSWLRIKNPTSRLQSTIELDDGEADAISLAKELGIKDILIDERRGRQIAVREGLAPLPTLALLERAAERDLVELGPAIEKLQSTNFRIQHGRVEAALAKDAARKKKRQ